MAAAWGAGQQRPAGCALPTPSLGPASHHRADVSPGEGIRLQAKYPAGNSCNNPSEPDHGEENGERGWS